MILNETKKLFSSFELFNKLSNIVLKKLILNFTLQNNVLTFFLFFDT